MATVALYSAATGLRSLETQLDVISNNIANTNNNGFKASRANFEDLMYQYLQFPGKTNEEGDIAPIGLGVGYGTRISGTELDFTQGSAVPTNGPLDVYIKGDGFFQLKTPTGVGNGTGLAYTRTGSFFINPDGHLVLNGGDGYMLDPQISLPTNATQIQISPDGRVSYTVPGNATPQQGPQIQLARFVNPQGLSQIGGNLYQTTGASGQPLLANPGENNTGQLQQGSLESSNVDPVKELVEMIKTQRAFELNSQTIQAADQMLQQISNLRH